MELLRENSYPDRIPDTFCRTCKYGTQLDGWTHYMKYIYRCRGIDRVIHPWTYTASVRFCKYYRNPLGEVKVAAIFVSPSTTIGHNYPRREPGVLTYHGRLPR